MRRYQQRVARGLQTRPDFGGWQCMVNPGNAGDSTQFYVLSRPLLVFHVSNGDRSWSRYSAPSNTGSLSLLCSECCQESTSLCTRNLQHSSLLCELDSRPPLLCSHPLLFCIDPHPSMPCDEGDTLALHSNPSCHLQSETRKILQVIIMNITCHRVICTEAQAANLHSHITHGTR